jgi:hypothetical protein
VGLIVNLCQIANAFIDGELLPTSRHIRLNPATLSKDNGLVSLEAREEFPSSLIVSDLSNNNLLRD